MSAGGPLLALTQGDPSGVGPDITLLAWLARTAESVPFYMIGDLALLARRATAIGLDVPLVSTSPADAGRVFARALPVVSLDRPVEGEPGHASPADAAATILAIETAVRHVREGAADAVVTNPIAKHVLYAAGFAIPATPSSWPNALAWNGACRRPCP